MLSLIPLSDANPTRHTPVVTIALIVLNILAFFFLQPGPVSIGGQSRGDAVYFIDNAPIPCQFEDSCPTSVPGTNLPIPDRTFPEFIGALLLAAFLHANLLHIGGNMLFLWVFGNNVEDFLRPVKFVAFYLLGAIASGMAQVLSDPSSAIPAVGASGAVGGVLGAYFVLYPRARVNTLVPLVFIWTVIQLSAFVVLGIWFVFQFLVPQEGVAWQAHVGGFVYGAVMIFLLGGRPHRPQPAWRPEWRY
ncbi:MAG: rhomboid family intramembrane serine protease [Actinomycetota bacterium]